MTQMQSKEINALELFLMEKVRELQNEGAIPVLANAQAIVKTLTETLSNMPGLTLENLQSNDFKKELNLTIVLTAKLTMDHPEHRNNPAFQALINNFAYLMLSPAGKKLSMEKREQMYEKLLKEIDKLNPIEENKVDPNQIKLMAKELATPTERFHELFIEAIKREIDPVAEKGLDPSMVVANAGKGGDPFFHCLFEVLETLDNDPKNRFKTPFDGMKGPQIGNH